MTGLEILVAKVLISHVLFNFWAAAQPETLTSK
jgi:hypothetical protein